MQELEKQKLEAVELLLTQIKQALNGETADKVVEKVQEVKYDFIDSNGKVHKPSEPYFLGEFAMCCGNPLSLENGSYSCRVCKSKYRTKG